MNEYIQIPLDTGTIAYLIFLALYLIYRLFIGKKEKTPPSPKPSGKPQQEHKSEPQPKTLDDWFEEILQEETGTVLKPGNEETKPHRQRDEQLPQYETLETIIDEEELWMKERATASAVEGKDKEKPFKPVFQSQDEGEEEEVYTDPYDLRHFDPAKALVYSIILERKWDKPPGYF